MKDGTLGIGPVGATPVVRTDGNSPSLTTDYIRYDPLLRAF